MIFWQLTLYAISVGMFFSVLAMGWGLILRSAKFFNLAYGGAFLVGGYMMFLFYRMWNVHFVFSILLSLFGSGLYMLLSYKFIFSVLLRRKAKSLILLIASFGLLTATSAILGMIFGNQSTLIARHLSDIYTVNVFGAVLNLAQVVAIVFVPVLIFVFAYIRSSTRFGRAMRAKDKTLLQIFFISGTLAGLVGIAEGFDLGLIPTSGLIIILPTIVATVVGGMQSFWGGILGAFILAIAQQLTIVFFGGSWVQAVPFVILIIMLLLRPQGILKR